MFETKAVFLRKEAEIGAENCVIDKTVHLSAVEFDRFSNNLLQDRDFIRDNQIEVNVDADGRRHCLLVTGEGRSDGILVNFSGYDYARYSAFLPNAKAIADAAQYPSLTDFSKRMMFAAAYVAGLSETGWPDGKEPEFPNKYAVQFRHLSDEFGLSFDGSSDLAQVFCRMLLDRPEIRDANYNTEEFLIDVEQPEAVVELERLDTEEAVAEYTEREFAAWKNVAAGISGNWREDRRYRQKKDGALYYLGGEAGQYMRIANDGKLTIGTYELAKPGIEDAILIFRATQQYVSYGLAFVVASRLAGHRFMEDVFQEKPSVLDQIREAKKAPPAPRNDKGGHVRGGPEL